MPNDTVTTVAEVLPKARATVIMPKHPAGLFSLALTALHSKTANHFQSLYTRGTWSSVPSITITQWFLVGFFLLDFFFLCVCVDHF